MDMLDLIAIGCLSVDLNGAQSGYRSEDMLSFNKYIGGSPTKIAIEKARLGLNSGLIGWVRAISIPMYAMLLSSDSLAPSRCGNSLRMRRRREVSEVL